MKLEVVPGGGVNAGITDRSIMRLYLVYAVLGNRRCCDNTDLFYIRVLHSIPKTKYTAHEVRQIDLCRVATLVKSLKPEDRIEMQRHGRTDFSRPVNLEDSSEQLKITTTVS